MIENIRVNVISNSITASDKAKSIHRRKISKCAGNLNYINHSRAEYRSFAMLTSFKSSAVYFIYVVRSNISETYSLHNGLYEYTILAS